MTPKARQQKGFSKDKSLERVQGSALPGMRRQRPCPTFSADQSQLRLNLQSALEKRNVRGRTLYLPRTFLASSPHRVRAIPPAGIPIPQNRDPSGRNLRESLIKTQNPSRYQRGVGFVKFGLACFANRCGSHEIIRIPRNEFGLRQPTSEKSLQEIFPRDGVGKLPTRSIPTLKGLFKF